MIISFEVGAWSDQVNLGLGQAKQVRAIMHFLMAKRVEEIKIE
jgi:hypothetical protein